MLTFRIQIIALSIFGIISFSAQLHAGFQDYVKDAVKTMGGGNGLTNKDKTSGRLQEAFKPITHQAMSEVGATRQYQALDDKMKTIPVADQMRFDLDQYVTEKALDGLFLMLAEEEQKIRQDPTARVTDLLQKVFASQ